MEQTVNHRIKALIEELKITPYAFAQKVGVDPTVIYNLIGRRYSKPSYELLYGISMSFDIVNTDWLLVGRGSMFKSQSKDVEDSKLQNLSKDEMLAKLINEMEYKSKQLQKCEEEVERLKNGRTPVYGK
jgi:transcriptional regulator with XRE-family HTH domain